MKATLELIEIYVGVIPHWKGLRTALYRKSRHCIYVLQGDFCGDKEETGCISRELYKLFLKGIFCRCKKNGWRWNMCMKQLRF